MTEVVARVWRQQTARELVTELNGARRPGFVYRVERGYVGWAIVKDLR